MNSLEIMSYIINQDPLLSAEIDLPKQGDSIQEIGKLISSDNRYRNAFINTVNLIGVTLIKKNQWENPWDFTIRGTMRFGQQVRELILDLVKANDYNLNYDNKSRFLETEVPNVLNYIHEVNFQKFYQTTTNDVEFAMAFQEEGNLMDFIENTISMLYESYEYDMYIVNKYMLCRRILDGTMTSVKIDNYSNLTPRQRVSKLKDISNKMTFRKPNYNPAGLRRATKFSKQIAIINTDFEADMSTEVLATSFFINEAEMKSQMRLIDGFGDHDTVRLAETLGNQYIPFTSDEITALAKIPAVIISDEWFMDYVYALDTAIEGGNGLKELQFYNPTTLENNHYLHAWLVLSTSPFENGVVFTQDTPAVSSVTVSPATATVTAGQSIQLSATVATTGFANKAVKWEITSGDGATVDLNGLVRIPSDFAEASITVTATSIYDEDKTGTATITLATDDSASV